MLGAGELAYSLGMRSFRVWMTSLLAGSLLSSAAGWCDVLNFYNSPPLTVKITSTAGDIIRYSTGWGRDVSVHRMNLTNRVDTVTTSKGKIYTGEVIYMDGGILQMRTPYGNTRLARIWVKKLILGMPKVEENPADSNQWMESTGQLQSNAAQLTQPSVTSASEPTAAEPMPAESEGLRPKAGPAMRSSAGTDKPLVTFPEN